MSGEQIFSHSTPLKIVLLFENLELISFHTMYDLFELLKGRELVFRDDSIEFEMLYVGELGILLAGISRISGFVDTVFDFKWTTGREVLNVILVEL